MTAVAFRATTAVTSQEGRVEMARTKYRGTRPKTVTEATVERPIPGTPADVVQYPEPPSIPWSLSSYPNAIEDREGTSTPS